LQQRWTLVLLSVVRRRPHHLIVSPASTDFDTGIIMFFAISYPGYSFPDWWGNNVFANTADGLGLAWKPMPDSGVFGPANGTWS